MTQAHLNLLKYNQKKKGGHKLRLTTFIPNVSA